ncbi:UDP-N-acetylmuramoyl-tripeptide--D-alanyl-D-alanine ligase [Sulfitobacter sp. HNIBRBA2951]|uniref:UDP-N-acetylmuramoyl-tripeptide--D-alanyl-D- alanine ligase n=1 Tax=Sulfitobacter aquimarinus TaxID=3158557 RepID=UPI0032DE56B1
MSLWTAAQAAEATGGKAVGDWAVDGVSIDTRTIEAGDLFVALQAARDGHDFVAQALESGAGAALVSRVPEGVSADAPLLIVDDVLKGLEALGAAARARTDAIVIGITGSVGKTSTKEMMLAMLSAQGRTHASVASYNNHWGVPLTLARMPANTEYAIIEMGMNHPGEILPLTTLAQPHAALITTVAAAHLEAFDNITGIALEKASIFDSLPIGAPAVYNADVETSAILAAKTHDKRLHGIAFGENGFDWKLKTLSIQGDTTVVQAEVDDKPLLFKLATPGRHFAMNALGALAVVQAIGADLAQAVAVLGTWTPYKGRGLREVIQLDPVEAQQRLSLIDDSYNANPTSMAASLEVLAGAQTTDGVGRIGKGRRIAFLGDMKELGEDAVALHAGIAHLPAVEDIDVIHCIGPLMRALYDLLPEQKRGLWTETSDEMCQGLRDRIDAGDVVLAKGSLSMKLGAVVDAMRKMGHPITDV